MTTLIPDNQRKHPLPSQYGTELFRCQVGSGVHGVTTGDDDRDEMGICLEPPRYVIGLDTFEQWEYRTQPTGHRSGPGDLDLTVYSLRKWMRLALAGNPTVLLPLFVPEDEVMINSESFRELRAHPDRFLSKQVATRFLGYMRSQREQMLGLRGKKHTNRPELIERYGYDTKFAYHMLRLGLQGVELLTIGTLTLPMDFYARKALKQVREGQWPREGVLDWASGLERELEDARDHSKLPDRPDREWANNWLVSTYTTGWIQDRN